MVHVAELNAAGTITEVGIDETAEPPLTTDNDTGVSFATEPVSVTRPVAFRPPWKVLGETDVDASCGGSTVSVVPVLREPSVAVTVAVVLLATVLVPSENLATCRPAGIETRAGLTEGSLLETLTVIPFCGEIPTSPTVPLAEVEPVTELGEKLREKIPG